MKKPTLTESITNLFPIEKCKENNTTLNNAIFYLLGIRFVLGFQNTELAHLLHTYMILEQEYIEDEMSILDEMKERLGM